MSDGETVSDLGLPERRACRCGSWMDVTDVEAVGEWKIVTWACRCERTFGAQVDPETNEVVNTEWSTI